MNRIKDILNRVLYPKKTDVGLVNTKANVGIHLRDDGCVEIYAGGKASILVDGKSGSITLNGQKISHAADDVNVIFSGGRLNIPFGHINPDYLPTKEETVPGANKALTLKRSPFMPTAGNSIWEDCLLLTGDPITKGTRVPDHAAHAHVQSDGGVTSPAWISPHIEHTHDLVTQRLPDVMTPQPLFEAYSALDLARKMADQLRLYRSGS